ncbi:3-deoxy-D-manno-octulosonic acid transferase [Castellaniella sp.]|uniref:3-deoxy-D-manno-octulosonic acid transferase n=1 Tax=Castellaniella sp. TaxID=1955812 RepID=UPI002AFE2574|nr:3-deoxy-D-manno-octulosonic acid transferase [Castellaniella sp.]
MSRHLYSWLLRLLSPLLLAWMGLRAHRAGGHWEVLGARRFGWYGAAPQPQSGCVWVHAVSLGETRAAQPLIQALLARGHCVLLTHLTASGRAEGQRVYASEIAQGALRQAWLPYDFPGAVRRFLRHHQPALGVLIERELWPNLVHGAQQAGIPLVLASARLSQASLQSTLRWGGVMRQTYRGLTRVYAQSLADAQRLQQLGARDVSVSGNFKFDLLLDQDKVVRGRAFSARLERRIVAVASTREGEDADFIRALVHYLGTRPHADLSGAPILFLLIPRHPQRFEQAADQLAAAGLPYVRRSQLLSLGDGSSSALAACQEAAVLLGDTLGEMPWYYACSQVAIVGGSFAPLGGQNFIEACALGCPVIVGPHVANFQQAVADALVAGALVQVRDADHAVRQALQWLEDPAELARVGAAGQYWVGQHRGAVARVLDGIEALLPQAVI